MKAATYFFFYAYVITLILAGAAGALWSPLDLVLRSRPTPT